MYDYYDDYYEPSDAELAMEEIQQILKKSLKLEIQEELERLRKENEELREFKKEKENYMTKLLRLESEYKVKLEQAERKVRQERIHDLLGDNICIGCSVESHIKQLVERYPYLMPRNVWTDKIPEDYDYTYIIGLELPEGWNKLFLQMCEDIRQPLIDADYLDKFRFTQVKEKYNRMVCYNNGAPEEVYDILNKYEVMASYVCTKCGRPAIYETQGYIASFCEDCWKDFVRYKRGEFIKFKPYFKISGYKNGEHYEKTISFEDEWNRYLKEINYVK